MKEVEARQLAAEIRELGKKSGQWVKVEEGHKPDLKEIIVTVSIKVEK
jgi:hypothetical protein